MKTSLLFLPCLAVVAASAQTSTKPPEPPVPVAVGPTREPQRPVVDNQRVYGPNSQDLLVPADVVNGVLSKFRAAYGSPNAPRLVIYVNRELIDTKSGLQLTGHTEKYEKSNDSLKTSGKNVYTAGKPETATLADKQTVREIERLFGRVFRNGGAKLADQKTAVDLLADKADQRLVGDQASRQREALSSIADIAIEVLISSRNLTMAGISGDQTVAIPDIQVTAIRLKDSAILGQASASDVLGKGQAAGQTMKTFAVPEITEATAIALMEDMLVGTN